MNQQIIHGSYDTEQGSLAGYIAGFVISLAFTLAAYFLAVNHALNKDALVALLALFALCQFFTQVILFLHLGQDRKPRYKQVVFYFMIGFVLIVVVGSLWIMSHLNHRMMASPAQEKAYMKSQSGI